MRVLNAMVAGMTGGVVISTGLWMGRFLFGIDVNLSMIWGTMLGLEWDWGTWVLGFLIHLGMSALAAVLYAWVFEHVVHRAGWKVGATLGVVHTAGAGLLMGFCAADPSPDA